MSKASQLEALCARGPWKASGRDVTADMVRRGYQMVRKGDQPNSGCEWDKVLQLLRVAGLIEYAGVPKRWRPVV